MRKTLLEIMQKREDLSDYLFHFTKGEQGLATLNKIIESNAVIDIGNKGVICFTEAPITLLSPMFDIFNRYPQPMYAQYGIAIHKEHLYNLGARPVIYGTKDEVDLLDAKLRWRFEEYIPNKKDFTWLREWRIPKNKVDLDKDKCFVITKTGLELDDITAEFLDIHFDGCVSDGQFSGDVIGLIQKKFKGISFEDLAILPTLSKTEITKLLAKQDLENSFERGLGGFVM
jgi:hypothetical protein